MKIQCGCIILWILCLQLGVVLARIRKQNRLEMEFEKLDIEKNPELMLLDISIANNNTVDMNLTLYKPINEGTTFFSMIIKIYSADFYQSLLTIKGKDFCKFLKSFANDPLLEIASSKFAQHTNLVRCPIKVGDYYIKNFSTLGIIPTGLISDGQYILNTSFVYKETENDIPFANISAIINISN